jgi:hypothetical protein
MSDCECVPDPGRQRFALDEILIYGVDLKNPQGKAELVVKRGVPDSEWAVTLVPNAIRGTTLAIVAAYGYAFEGHCYRFDRPRILVFKQEAGPIAAHGCGFDVQGTAPDEYRMWRVSAGNEVMELAAQNDTFRKIVLEANLPGRRPPNTYASEMMLAHRGGRLTGAGS